MSLKLETKQLYLLPLQMNHAKDFYLYRSDSDTNQYQGWIPYGLEDAKYFIKNKIATELNIDDSWYQLVLIKKENQKLIGDIGIHFLSDQITCEIGCTIAKSELRKGYASEALQEVIYFLINKLNKSKINAYTHPKNMASQKMLLKLGFNSHGTSHFDDDLLFTINRNDWQKNCKSNK